MDGLSEDEFADSLDFNDGPVGVDGRGPGAEPEGAGMVSYFVGLLFHFGIARLCAAETL